MKKVIIVFLTIVIVFTTCPILEAVAYIEDEYYYVSFDANGGEGEMYSYELFAGDEIYIPSCEFIHEGYIFRGWNTAPDGSGEQYNEWDYVNVYENITLYAIWIENPIEKIEIEDVSIIEHSNGYYDADTFIYYTPSIKATVTYKNGSTEEVNNGIELNGEHNKEENNAKRRNCRYAGC